jgi:hypothetical protein
MRCSRFYVISSLGVLGLAYGIAIISLSGCAGAINGGGSNSSPTISGVSVSCSPAAIQMGQTSQCAATVSGTGSYSSAITWSASGGTITSTGVFTPSGAGTATITATSTEDTTKTGSSSVVISAATGSTITSVTVSCLPASITTAQTSACTATVSGTGSYSSAVSWSATGGAITSAGVFTPNATGTATITATSTQNAAKSGSSSVVVSAVTGSTITSVTVSCLPLSITTAQTSSCAATVSGTGSYSSAVTWSATGGTITSAGVFTPSATGTAIITATSTQDTTKSGSKSVVVSAAAAPTITAVTVSCSPSSITTSQTTTCSATVSGTGNYSSAVTWSATGGAITTAGVFTPSATGTAIITATSTQDTTKSGSKSVVVSVPATSTQYRAYGASTTVGLTLSNPSTQSYPALVAAFENVPLANRAISGDQACDVPATQIFSNGDSPKLTTHTVSSTLIGTNDVDVKGTGTYEAIYMLCDRAIISWLGVPLEYKVLANGANMSKTGSGSIDSTWNAWTTGAQGATVSFTITTVSIGPIYAWPLIDDRSSATYTYSLDGTVIGTSNVQTSPQMATQNGTTRSLGFIRIPSVSAGTHVVTFTQTSVGTNGVSVVGVGAPFGGVNNQLPTVLVGTITYQWPGGGSEGCTSSDAPCLQYIQDQRTDITLLSGDGLDVRLFDTRQYMFGTASEMNDALHPNAFGQLELSHSVEAVW